MKNDSQNAYIKITNMQGAELFENNYALLLKDNPFVISTKDIPSGVYFFTIIAGNVISTQKFLVIR